MKSDHCQLAKFYCCCKVLGSIFGQKVKLQIIGLERKNFNEIRPLLILLQLYSFRLKIYVSETVVGLDMKKAL